MNNQQITANVSRMIERDERVRKCLVEAFELHVGDPKPDNYIARGLIMAELGVMLFNVIYSMRHPGAGLGSRTTMDLMVNLNGNAAWAEHGMVLMPLLHMAGQAQIDYATLAFEKQKNPTVSALDEITSECKLVGLEIFSMLVFLMGGATLLAGHSIGLKQQLEGILNG